MSNPVQSKLTQWPTSTAQGTCALPNPITAGNALVVLIYFHNPSDTVSSVVDNLTPVTSYSVLSALAHDVTDSNQAFVSYIGFPTGSGTPTITVNLSASATSGYIYVAEVSGLASSPFDESAISTSTGTPTDNFTSGTTGTTAAANEFLFTWWGTLSLLATVTFTPGTNWTLDKTLNVSGLGVAGATLYRVVSSTGTYQGAVSKSGSAMTSWGMQIITLETVGISGNAGVAGATVSYSGTASGSVVADGSGNYTIPGLANGSYTITPSLTGYIFSPTSRNETMSGSNITGVNFTATAIYTVSGNCGIAGATITYSGQASGSTTTDSTGSFSVANLVGGSYTFGVAKAGNVFSPLTQSFTLSANTILIFTGYPATSPVILTQTATENFTPNANPLNPSNWETGGANENLQAINSTCEATVNAADDCVESWIGTTLSNDQYVQAKLAAWIVGNGQDIILFVDTDVATVLTGLSLGVTDNGAGGTADIALTDFNNSTTVFDSPSATVAVGDIFIVGSVGKTAFLFHNGVLLFSGPWSGGTGTVALECDTEVGLTDCALADVAMGSVKAVPSGGGGGGFGPGGSGGTSPNSFGFRFGF